MGVHKPIGDITVTMSIFFTVYGLLLRAVAPRSEKVMPCHYSPYLNNFSTSTSLTSIFFNLSTHTLKYINSCVSVLLDIKMTSVQPL